MTKLLVIFKISFHEYVVNIAAQMVVALALWRKNVICQKNNVNNVLCTLPGRNGGCLGYEMLIWDLMSCVDVLSFVYKHADVTI